MTAVSPRDGSAPGASGEGLRALAAVGTSVWIDAIRRAMLTGGELERRIAEDSVVGMTSNPAIFEKAILGSTDYDERLAELAHRGLDGAEIYETLALEDVSAAADGLRPTYDGTDGLDGYVSIEVAPELARDPERTLEAARGFWSHLGRPNVMVKIPGTQEGVEPIREAIAAGINVNVTLLFAVEAYERVSDAYLRGLEERLERGEQIDGIASVASFFVSRVDTAADAALREQGHDALAGRAAVANAQVAYAHFQEVIASERWARLAEAGAKPQRLLWASTGTKDPTYSDVKYVEELAGPNTVNTMPLATLDAFADHGEARDALSGTLEQARETLGELERAGIDMAEVTERLLDEGIDLFAEAMDKLLDGIEQRRAAVVAGRPRGVEAALSAADAERIAARAAWARAHDVAHRIWRRDHTLWDPDPAEISDRLGWLTVVEAMPEQLDDLEAFAEEARADGLTHVLLLGMGGSSLAPEVLRRALGPGPGGLALTVLDSTHPDAVAAVVEALPLETTLVVVSTKSGGTLETLSLYEAFRARIEDPRRFVAITDPGSSLAELAEREGFRRTFLGDPDIGGRYSALSPFGLVPAALLGLDLRALVERAEEAVQSAAPELAPTDSPALWLGCALGNLASAGRDKLTLVIDEPLEALGLWLEQLVAESTGKAGRGIVPVAGEPLGEPGAYGADRVFVHLRRERGESRSDEALRALADQGHPVLTMTFRDGLDLGGLFFTWEMAVAVAGAVLEVNPFDQPDVQEAKDQTAAVLAEREERGVFAPEHPDVAEGPLQLFGAPGAGDVATGLAGLLEDAAPPGYLALLAYGPEDERFDEALERVRVAVRDARRVATTAGYGPRYLHSTGQLHKGGPPVAVVLLLTTDAHADIGVPGRPHGFDVLVSAQAIGDERALRARGLRLLRVHLVGNAANAAEHLAEAVERVLSAT